MSMKHWKHVRLSLSVWVRTSATHKHPPQCILLIPTHVPQTCLWNLINQGGICPYIPSTCTFYSSAVTFTSFINDVCLQSEDVVIIFPWVEFSIGHCSFIWQVNFRGALKEDAEENAKMFGIRLCDINGIHCVHVVS